MNALSVVVLRSGKFGDCTNGGISARYDELLILCEDGPVELDGDNLPENTCIIVDRYLFGGHVYHIEPIYRPREVGWMSGGNFAHSCDGRFAAMTGGMYGAVSIHDRQETQERYNALSH